MRKQIPYVTVAPPSEEDRIAFIGIQVILGNNGPFCKQCGSALHRYKDTYDMPIVVLGKGYKMETVKEDGWQCPDCHNVFSLDEVQEMGL